MSLMTPSSETGPSVGCRGAGACMGSPRVAARCSVDGVTRGATGHGVDGVTCRAAAGRSVGGVAFRGAAGRVAGLDVLGPTYRVACVLALALAPPLLPSGASAQALTLDEAVEAALSNHPAVTAAAARAEGAGEAAAAARSSGLPAVSASAQLTRFQEPMVVAPFHAFDPTNPPRFDETLVQGRLSLDYTLFDAGGRAARVRATDASAEGAELGLEMTEMELLERVAGAYFGVLSSRAVRASARAHLEALEEEQARARQAVDAGSAAEVEAMRAAAALQDARAQASAAEARAALTERALARLMGVAPDQVVGRPLADVTFSPGPVSRESEPPESDMLQGGASALHGGAARESPRVSRAEAAARAAEARLAEERAARLPRVALAAGLLDFGTPRGNHVLEWQAGVQVSWAVFTGGARGAAVRRADAEALAARADVVAAELEVAHAIDEARTAIAEADAREEALRVAVEQWTEVARIESLGLEAGAGVQSDLLTARASLFRASAGRAAARYEALMARVRLARARGILDRDWLARALEVTP